MAEQVKVIERLDNTNEKYIVVLKFVNRILVNIGNEEIDDLTKFVSIDRDDIIKNENNIALKEMEGEIFEYFNKTNSRYYNKTKNLVLNVLKSLLKQIGYDFTKKSNNKSIIIDGRKYNKTFTFYTII